ncbi:hypothetical protein F2Q69_00014122 [Brassica cretica]|uniref:Uncharacterized protein n=1 Tax=Brassica cretica TaxID=69181 RepID=A0A8S9QZB5_BRACR|nr:hypothetical protein F2Q69_00014122 [Brassica cretica]
MKSLETYKFKGGINTFEAEEWMHMIAKKFEAMICPAKYKKRVAVYYLQEDAQGVLGMYFRRSSEGSIFIPRQDIDWRGSSSILLKAKHRLKKTGCLPLNSA